jgi:hypothetical protein
LLDLAGDIEGEEFDIAKENDTANEEMEDSDNDLEGWVDEVATFTPKEQQDLEASI